MVHAFTADSAEADRPGRSALPEEAGGNRVVWNLMCPGPEKPEDVVIWGYTGGVKAPPGTYRARLVTGGETAATRSFRVAADPQLEGVTQADDEAQHELGTAIRDTLDAVWDALRRIRDVKAQVSSASDRAARVRFGDLNDEWAGHRCTLERILDRDLAALNRLLRDEGMPAVVTEAGR